MRGWSFSVGVKLWPPGVVVEFAPAEEEYEEEADTASGRVSDRVIDVDEFEGLWAMGFAPARRAAP